MSISRTEQRNLPAQSIPFSLPVVLSTAAYRAQDDKLLSVTFDRCLVLIEMVFTE